MSRTLKKIFIFSDTHFFCRSSKLHGRKETEFRNRLMHEIAEADIIVMNGDIFDLIFPELINSAGSRKETIKQACVKAEEWLDKICQACPNKEIYFNLGNHENIRKFWRALKRLEEKYDGVDGKCKFTANKHYTLLGTNLFLHGDLEMAKVPLEQRAVPKVRNLPTARKLEQANFHLEYIIQSAMNRINKTPAICRRVLEQISGNTKLNEEHPDILSKVKKIFFGHTHIPIIGYIWSKFSDIMSFNTGSATNHGNDSFFRGEIEVSGKGKYGNIIKLERLHIFGKEGVRSDEIALRA